MVNESGADLAIPKGSLILITGATGHVASNIVEEALSLGYRVRGTVRSKDKAAQLESIFPSDAYSSFIVEDMSAPGAYDAVVQGVDAIIHPSTVTSYDPDPKKVIPATVTGATGILHSALKSSTVKQVVYTSTTPSLHPPNVRYKIDRNTWDDVTTEAAWAPPPYTSERSFLVYKASKTAAERAVWEFVKTQKPHFAVNVVLPCVIFGRIVTSPSLPGQWPIDILNGKMPSDTTPGNMVNMTDVARIHVAAAIDRSVTNERIMAFGYPFTWDEVIDAVQAAKPAASLPSHDSNKDRDLSEVDNSVGKNLLSKWWGQPKYTDLKETIKQNLEGI